MNELRGVDDTWHFKADGTSNTKEEVNATKEEANAIVFDNVHFRYPGRPKEQILAGVSFRAKIGQMVALVGPSGNGKTTLTELMAR